MRRKLRDFDQKSAEIVEQLASNLKDRPQVPILYHYTTEAGLRGILESGKIRLTDIFYLNDPSELRHGLAHAVEILRAKAQQGPQESKLFSEQFEAFLQKGGLQAAAHFFTCSFSEDGDDLGQWRAYAANGQGYALGFEARKLDTAYTWARPQNNHSYHIIYDDNKLRDAQQRIVNQAFPLISLPKGRGLSPYVINYYMSELYISLSLHTLNTALFFKHEAYSNEREFRFLQIFRAPDPVPNVKFRTRPYSLVRYRELDWRGLAADSLSRIVIGPAADLAVATRFANDCVGHFHIGKVDVTQSKIPYRPS
jgi:hypothetical protein